MSEWKAVTLGNIASVITGPFGSQLHQSDYVEEGIPSIMPLNIGNRTVDLNGIACISEKDAERLNRYRVQKGDIVYSRRGDVEKHAFITAGLSGALCGTGCLRVRFTDADIHPEFISLYLDRPETKKWIRQHVVGSSMPNLNTGILSDVPISYPSKDIQVSISMALSTIEAKIQLNNSIIAELETMAKTIYDYWFVQFDFPNEEGQPYRASGGEMVWNEQLKREIPKGWMVSSLPKLCEIVDCLHSEKPSMNFENERFYLLQLENIADYGLINLANKYYVSKHMFELWTSRIEVSEGDLVITNAGRVGSVARIPNYVKAGIGRNMTALRPVSLPACFFYYFITGSDVAGQIKVNTDSGSFFGSLNVRGIKELQVTLPPEKHEHLLQAFESCVYPMRNKIESCAAENLKLVRLRDWLLPMLMNGQVTVE